jgi:hypothetical protein
MACCETYIISLATVRDITGLAKIVSDVKLAPFLRLSQQELEKVLGRTLYDELDDAVQADSTLTGETALIALMRYVKYALAWRTLQRALPRMAAEPTANGVHTVSDGAYQSSDRALTQQITDARTAADEAYTLLIDFLKNNLTTYPTYETEVENEERVKKMYTGGVITRKSRWQYPYGLKTPRNGNQYDECCDDAN